MSEIRCKLCSVPLAKKNRGAPPKYCEKCYKRHRALANRANRNPAKARASRKKYDQSDKGKASRKNYERKRGRAPHKKYEQSEKGRAARRKNRAKNAAIINAAKKKYGKSPKYIAVERARKRWQSENGREQRRAANRKYEQTEKGRQAVMRKLAKLAAEKAAADILRLQATIEGGKDE